MKSNLVLLSLFVLFLASCGNKPGSGNNSSSSAGIYSVGGSISGLTTAGLKLRNNGADEITIAPSATLSISLFGFWFRRIQRIHLGTTGRSQL